jgi:hypothetical protein
MTIANINDLLNEYCANDEEEIEQTDHSLIGTLENATQKIISGLNDLKAKCNK